MSPGKLFFSPVDPFRKQPALLGQAFLLDGYELELRPFWLAGDLQMLYKWLTDPATKQNAGLSRGQKFLFPHFRDLLESSTAQPLTLVRDNKEVAQFSFLPVQQESWAGELDSRAFDCSIRYVFARERSPSNVFRHTLLMLARYFYASGNTGNLYLLIPAADHTINSAAQLSGYNQTSQFTSKSEKHTLYVYTQKQWNDPSFEP